MGVDRVHRVYPVYRVIQGLGSRVSQNYGYPLLGLDEKDDSIMGLYWASPYQWKLPYVRSTFFYGLGNGMPGLRKYFAWPSFLQEFASLLLVLAMVLSLVG